MSIAGGGTVTVLFTDLVGSTELLERLGDDEYEELRRTYFQLLRNAIAARSGHEVKTMGDGLMVAFPSALDAVACAVSMQQAVHRHNHEQGHSSQLHLRVGLETGEPIRHEEDYFGTPVVIAKRLCDSADGAQIRASQLVRLLIGSRGGYTFRGLEPLSLKGLAEPVVAFEVRWEPSDAESDRSAATQAPPPPLSPLLLSSAEHTAFVGREAELEELRHAWERAAEGKRELVLLSGDAGIGKTRLATEFARSVHQSGAAVLIGRADEDGFVACQPFVEALREYALASPTGIHGARAAALADELARLASEPSEPAGAAGSLLDRVVALLAEASRQAPVLLILDDLQWADRPAFLLLRRLLRPTRAARQEPLLVVATYRQAELGADHPLAELLAVLRRDHALQRIALGGLSEHDVSALVDTWAGGGASQAFIRAVHQQTEGNPFFIEEVLRHIAESGLSGGEGAAAKNAEAALTTVPEGVKEVIRQRLSRLSEGCNSVLTIASVIGRHFGLDALERASDVPANRLLELLEEAVAARVITEDPRVVGQYSFAHALIHETLYDELTTTRRVHLHGQTLQYADSNGVKLAYEVLGASGPYLAAVGLSNCPAVRTRNRATTQRWEPLLRHCRLVLYDRRGVGFSAAPERGYSLMAGIEDLRAVLDAAGARRAVLWGAADGGPLAIAFAVQYPERVAGLLLLGTTAKYAASEDFPWGVNPSVIESFLRTDAVDRDRAVSGLMQTRPSLGVDAIKDVMRRVPARVWSKVIAGVGGADVRHLVSSIRVPTLIIHDPENSYIPVAAAGYLHSQIPGSRLEINAEYGTALLGESVYGQIEAFIDEVTGPAGT